MIKERLFTPGPTEVPLRVLKAMQIASLHHRTTDFKTLLSEASKLAIELLGRTTQPIFLACSGTGAMEATLVNLCSEKDSIAAVTAGAFGDRWKDIASRLKLNCAAIEAPWGSTPPLNEILTAVEKLPMNACFCIQHSETSTTLEHPLSTILPAIKSVRPDILTVVDGISAFATTPLPSDPNLIDAYIIGSQKGLMLPPGLSIVSLSDKAWQHIQAKTPSSLYFDFNIERKALLDSGSAWTPATTLIVGFVESARMLLAEGMQNVYARHAKLAKACRASVSALGFSLLAPEYPAAGVTGFYPSKVDAEALRKQVKTLFGAQITAGQGKLAGKILRIGHMGWIDELDLIAVIGAIELTLNKLGHHITLGQGTTAALKSLAE